MQGLELSRLRVHDLGFIGARFRVQGEVREQFCVRVKYVEALGFRVGA